jgi:F0F1-type ATP synthase delta subunit
MTKPYDTKDICEELIKKYPREVCLEIIKELRHQLDTAEAKIYYCGELTSDKRQMILDWLHKKTQGNFNADFIEDSTLIGGLKIIYKDFIFDSSVLGGLREGH